MFLFLSLGFLSGISLIIYKGLYLGPWPQALQVMGSCIAAALVIYFVLRILIGVGGFLFKLAFLALIIFAVFFGGKKVWHRYLPNQPIKIPTEIGITNVR